MAGMMKRHDEICAFSSFTPSLLIFAIIVRVNYKCARPVGEKFLTIGLCRFGCRARAAIRKWQDDNQQEDEKRRDALLATRYRAINKYVHLFLR